MGDCASLFGAGRLRDRKPDQCDPPSRPATLRDTRPVASPRLQVGLFLIWLNRWIDVRRTLALAGLDWIHVLFFSTALILTGGAICIMLFAM